MVRLPETKCKHRPSAYNEVREGKGTKGINQIYKQRIEVLREEEEVRREEREWSSLDTISAILNRDRQK